ncbi:xanthine dehydrogenase family protein molybdopterin-binding subunit [Cupriavidus lacunae]|uniref:Xanthine dehydrogenase family protein molybdopterin-binding subunit n=1 Tax=Cupriavidus lacunae TaxID=2666307 RepID=A0A370NRN3_9BURK|nr:molybdopterin cofactor-binding domain-containing protein [Cupriavidus lacunae]RDK08193.1 xanthine dehydrogenase family protein molybdopterin-binding subunit [Cupriavidus lacunae]
MSPDDKSLPDSPARRAFMVSGSIVVGFTLLPGRKALAEVVLADEGAAVRVARDFEKLAGSLKTNPYLDAWIKVAPDNRVTVCTGKVELGTGVRTALLQVAAEELQIDPGQITFLTADTGRSPDEGLTAGSHTMADSGSALLNAAAQVRGLLTDAAARTLRTDPATLTLRNARVHAADGRSKSFAELLADVDLHVVARPTSALRDPASFTVIGTALPRLDIPGKVTGGPSYVQDLKMPGMVHARVVLPPAYDAPLQSVDEAGARATPGFFAIVRDGNLLAVVAQREWQAVQAQRALSAGCRWGRGRALPQPGQVTTQLRQIATERIVIADTRAPMATPVKTLDATYTKPYLMHGSIGPSCAVGHMQDGVLTVWTHSQGVYPLRDGLAGMLSMPRDKIRCIHMEGSGCYGHNGADDAAAHAAFLARALPGRPVRVQWMRDQENLWDHFTPAMVAQVKASLAADGTIVNWDYALWSSSHNERVVNAGRLLPATHLARPFTPAPSVPMTQPEGGGDRNAIPLYRLPNRHIVNNFSPTMPLRTSAMRSLGAHLNVFAIETFMDDLAHAAGVDPVQFRLRHMDDPRALDVIRLAAQEFGWPQRARKPGHGAGFAFARYKNLMGYVAMAMEISVERDTGQVRLEHAEVAVDCGQIVNPDGVRNQLEGGILQSASWTLYEQLHFDEAGIRSFDWGTYPIMRFSTVPTQINVHLIDRPGAPFLGVAEAAMGPTAGAIGNALFDATGVRLRDMPLGGERLRARIAP